MANEETGNTFLDLPLFPLRTVLFPGGPLALKVFEVRYLDMMSRCLREGSPFGVVCLNQGTEVSAAHESAGSFERVGVIAQLLEVDSDQPGVLQAWCEGGLRFAIEAEPVQVNGLWVTPRARALAPDSLVMPAAAFKATVDTLDRALSALAARTPKAVPRSKKLGDAGWVANRWCELLPISLRARQQLMALEDPVARLTLVDDYLRKHRLI
jgi:Lon protease-like protein